MDDDEQAHMDEIVQSFRYYRTHALKQVASHEAHFHGVLSSRHQSLLPSFPAKIQRWKAAVESNAAFLEEVVAPCELFDGNQSQSQSLNGGESGGEGAKATRLDKLQCPSEHHMSKVRSTSASSSSLFALN
jgi:hypothetical protein